MTYRKISAEQIFDGKKLRTDQVLIVEPDGTIEAIVPKAEAGQDVENVYGILTPGFINCHCHLELSHLKGVVAPGAGLVDFLLSVIKTRKESEAGKEDAIRTAEAELYRNGIVGVGDICNTTDALQMKKNSSLYWFSFVEVFNFWDHNRAAAIARFTAVADAHRQAGLKTQLTAHAPYSVSASTLDAINEATTGGILSVHNQESAAENEWFRNGEGSFLQYYDVLAAGKHPISKSGKSSLQTWLPHFINGQTILLVHNTFITEEDIIFAKEHAQKHCLQLVYCLCPNANLYIENKLPPVDLLIKHNCRIVLGTDSYSSNWQLSIAAEVKTLLAIPYLKNKEYGGIEMILQWATTAGADVMKWTHIGRFEKGLRPGAVLINENTFSAERII